MLRIAIAGISHEALTFSPLTVPLDDLRVRRGQAILDDLRQRVDIDRPGVELVPIVVAGGQPPSGIVEQATYLQLRNEIVDGLLGAGPLDGVCLILHGAMLVEHIGAGETDLVRAIRAALGYDVLISARFDLHANVEAEFASKTDIWTSFRTAPHRDTDLTTVRALDLLIGALQSGKRPRPVYVPVPLLLQGEKAMTDDEPMKTLLQMARAVEQRPGIICADVLVGFGWADAPHSGSSAVVIAESDEHLPAARAAALELGAAMWERREQFGFGLETADSIDEGIRRALAAPESCVFLSDSGDNVTAGATGDVPIFFERLIAAGVEDAVLINIVDAESVERCQAAGVGATVDLEVGGKLDRLNGDPVPARAVVERIFRSETDPNEATIVTIRVGGVRAVLTDRRRFFTRLADFALTGIDPLEHKIVVVKLGYLMPELFDAAPRSIMTISPGCAAMDLRTLPFRYVTHPVFPLDDDFAWQPAIMNTARFGQ